MRPFFQVNRSDRHADSHGLQRLDRRPHGKTWIKRGHYDLLVMGGVRAQAVSTRPMINSLSSLDGARLQVIHLTGTRDEN